MLLYRHLNKPVIQCHRYLTSLSAKFNHEGYLTNQTVSFKSFEFHCYSKCISRSYLKMKCQNAGRNSTHWKLRDQANNLYHKKSTCTLLPSLFWIFAFIHEFWKLFKIYWVITLFCCLQPFSRNIQEKMKNHLNSLVRTKIEPSLFSNTVL